jgi:hypothetical protein
MLVIFYFFYKKHTKLKGLKGKEKMGFLRVAGGTCATVV